MRRKVLFIQSIIRESIGDFIFEKILGNSRLTPKLAKRLIFKNKYWGIAKR